MKYSIIFVLPIILLSSCTSFGSNANEPLAIDRISKTFTQKFEVTLQDPPPIDEDSIELPLVQQIKFVPPEIGHSDGGPNGEGYEGPTENIGTVSTVNGPYGDDNSEIINEVVSNDEEIFTIAEEMPEFPGGQAALNNYLVKNIDYPVMAKEQGIQGKVWVGFVVDKEGIIKDVKILKGIGGGCDEEAKRVVSKMPKWTPGKMNGRNVNVKFNLPINFKLL